MEKEKIQDPKVMEKSIVEFLQELEQSLLMDDHGSAVIGDRKRKPKWPE